MLGVRQWELIFQPELQLKMLWPEEYMLIRQLVNFIFMMVLPGDRQLVVHQHPPQPRPVPVQVLQRPVHHPVRHPVLLPRQAVQVPVPVHLLPYYNESS